MIDGTRPAPADDGFDIETRLNAVTQVPSKKFVQPRGFAHSISLTLDGLFAQARDEAIVTSLLDTDFYKLAMNQLMRVRLEVEDREKYGGIETWGETEVVFSWINRTEEIKPHEVIDIDELRAQLEAARQLSFSDAELSYIAGMPINPERTRRMFSGWFIQELMDFRLPEFDLSQAEDGSFMLKFPGTWAEATYWEIVGMVIISEMYYYGLLKKHEVSANKIQSIYSGMMNRLEDMVAKFKEHPELNFSEFGTRRRNSKAWQAKAYDYLRSELPGQCIGTSNVEMSMKTGSSNPIGTNAHELPMVVANLGDDSPEYIRQSQYDVVEKWQKMYPELSILLPDTFGTKQFLDNAPAWVAESSGARPDSMEPTEATDLYVAWWMSHNQDLSTKIMIPSDGLNPDTAVAAFQENVDKIGRLSFGIGTTISNGSKGVTDVPDFRPFSQVAKVTEANGRPACKLSDNPNKATGDPARVAYFKEIFGTDGHQVQDIEV